MINNPPNIQLTSGFEPFSTCINRSTSIDANSTVEIVGDNPNRMYAAFINVSTSPVTLILGARNDGNIDKGIPINPGGSFEINSENLYRGKISVVAVKAAKISWVEGSKGDQ
jgi:hypothetical protein